MPVTVDTSLPLLDDRDRDWDGPAAASAMAAECGGRGETLDSACMSTGFLWRDPDTDEGNLGAYKLPVADIVDGSKRLIWSGAAAAASRLDATDGLTDTDRDRARSALAVIYRRFADLFNDDTITPPWEDTTAAADNNNTRDTNMDDGCGCCAAGHKPADKQLAAAVDEATTLDRVIRASAADGGDWTPQRDWFTAQDPAPLTITSDGQVYGDLARFGQRHIGADGHDIYPPKDPDGLYRAFRQRTINTSDGPIAVGVLTMDTGHAGMGIGADAAVEHYDHTGAIVAAVNIGEDDAEGGRIWLAGALLPDVTPEQRLRLMLSGVSGDWRQTQSRGPLELVAALAVNVPGFPVPAAEVADGRELAVVAAGAIPPRGGGGEVTINFSDGVATELADLVSQRVTAAIEQREHDQRRLSKARTASAHLKDCVRVWRARKAQAGLVAAGLKTDDGAGPGKA
jgi:hypothetical protein